MKMKYYQPSEFPKVFSQCCVTDFLSHDRKQLCHECPLQWMEWDVFIARAHLLSVCVQGMNVCVCVCVCRCLSDAASKHAVQAFFDCLRAEMEEYGIVVSTISHTFINASDLAPVKELAPKPNTVSACE